ncbi:MAG: O-antigen ligase family protein [Candidatus Diapherotrites archaeon]|nr:O-antigen ligase family protein [Candidatus Diapherotrites archaeon]
MELSGRATVFRIFFTVLFFCSLVSAAALLWVSGDFAVPLLVFAVFFAAALLRPVPAFYALAVFAALSPFLQNGFSAENILLAEFALLGFAASALSRAFFSEKGFAFKAGIADFFAGGFFLFSGAAFVAGVFAGNAFEPYPLRLAVLSFEFILLYLIGRGFFTFAVSPRKSFIAMLAAAVFLAVSGIILFNFHSAPGAGLFLGFQGPASFYRLEFPFFYENAAGLFFAVFFSSAFSFALFSHGWKRMLFLFSCLPLLLALLYTYSRGAWILALLGVLAAMLLKLHNWPSTARQARGRTLALGLSAAACLLLMFSVAILYGTVFGNSGEATPSEYSFFNRLSVVDRSPEIRAQVFSVSARAALQEPFFGNGFGSFEMAYFGLAGKDFGGPKNAHNSFLHFALERGVPAGLFFLFFQAALVFLLAKRLLSRRESSGACAALFLSALIFFAGGFFEFALFSARNAFVFWLFAGMSIGASGGGSPEKQVSWKHLLALASAFSVVFAAFSLAPFLLEAQQALESGISHELKGGLVNPGFEDGFKGWDSFNNSEIFLSENARSGKRSMGLRVEGPTKSWAGLSTFNAYAVSLEPDSDYVLSAFFFVPENGDFSGTFRLSAFFFGRKECAGKPPECLGITFSGLDQFVDGSAPRGGWFERRLVFRTGGEIAGVRPSVITSSNLSGRGTILVDDMSIEKAG